MIVSCANCSTKYNLPDDKVPPEGIKVKCSKCSNLFKVTPPPATPEEEVEVLLDDSDEALAASGPDQSADFDAAFEEAVAGGDADSDSDPDAGIGDELDDMFSDDDDAIGADAAGADAEDDLDDLDFGDDTADDDAFAADVDDVADVDDDDDDDDFGIDDDMDVDDDEEPSSGGLDLGDGESGLFSSLDGEDKAERKKGGLGRMLLMLVLFLLLIVVVATATFNMRLWSVPESMQDMAIELPFELPVAVPFIKGPGEQAMDMTDSPEEPMQEAAAPMGDPMERIKKIQPVDFRQYVINNEIEGRIFVVEGKALNNSETPKEQIKVEVALFAADGTEMSKQELLCGNTLSLFQLQVDNRQTIEENLTSERGTSLNNSYIKPGETTPFMFVFFGLDGKVEEYRISITDALEPQR